jgi:hypothetical protein
MFEIVFGLLVLAIGLSGLIIMIMLCSNAYNESPIHYKNVIEDQQYEIRNLKIDLLTKCELRFTK